MTSPLGVIEERKSCPRRITRRFCLGHSAVISDERVWVCLLHRLGKQRCRLVVQQRTRFAVPRVSPHHAFGNATYPRTTGHIIDEEYVTWRMGKVRIKDRNYRAHGSHRPRLPPPPSLVLQFLSVVEE